MLFRSKTVFQPSFELDDALRAAALLGAEITVLEADILAFPEVVANPADRCYFCKSAIFSLIKTKAAQDGFPVLIDGTNASDDAGDRPGMKVLREFGVRSPLRECGITKDEVRRLSREAGLFTWDKPAYACLATRVPTGTQITADDLSRVERAEDSLFALGFSDFRVRLLGRAARLQFPAGQMAAALNMRETIIKQLQPDFESILLDLAGR